MDTSNIPGSQAQGHRGSHYAVVASEEDPQMGRSDGWYALKTEPCPFSIEAG